MAALKTLHAAQPPKGEAAFWKEKTDALVAAGEKLEKGEADAGAALKAAANCKSCHDVHRTKNNPFRESHGGSCFLEPPAFLLGFGFEDSPRRAMVGRPGAG